MMILGNEHTHKVYERTWRRKDPSNAEELLFVLEKLSF